MTTSTKKVSPKKVVLDKKTVEEIEKRIHKIERWINALEKELEVDYLCFYFLKKHLPKDND